MEKVRNAINYLLMHQPFYAHFFINGKVEYDTRKVPTAAVFMSRSGPVFIFNSKFINSLSDVAVAAVVEHEVKHVLFRHTKHFKDSSKHEKTDLEHFIQNVAQDCAINQDILNSQAIEGSITLEFVSKVVGQPLEPKREWTYYHHFLKLWAEEKEREMMKSLQQAEQNTHGTGSLDKYFGNDPIFKEMMDLLDKSDSHSFDMNGEQLEEKDTSLYNAVLRDVIRRVLKCKCGNAGTLPQSIQTLLEELNAPPQLDWRQKLKNFIGRTIINKTRHTRSKTNRRYGIDQPGRKKKRSLKLGICADTSGSVSDDAFRTFVSEINHIVKSCEITVIYMDADCQVHDTKTVTANKKLKYVRNGAGGTAYQPAITKCLEIGVDAIVYFGDGDTSDTPEDPRIPFIWALVGDSERPGDFGDVVRIKDLS